MFCMCPVLLCGLYAVKLIITKEIAEIGIILLVIQQIRAMPIYGQNARVICHMYSTDILLYYSTNARDANIWSMRAISVIRT